MSPKRILGILLAVVGVGLIVFSGYISDQVAEGRQKISSAQKSVNKGQSLFDSDPVAKQVGKGLFGGAQKQIDEGRREADSYDALASQLRIAGIVAIAIGGLVFFLSRRK